MNELQQMRSLEVVAAEINALTASMLGSVIEIGRRMCEAKELLPHGEFGNWIRENTGYSSSTANNFMRIFQEYGSAQGSLFGDEVNCQTFGKLSYSKALTLLALPAGEREDFVLNNDVEAMSTRELQQAIRERDDAMKREKELEEELAEIKEARDDLADAVQKYKEDLEGVDSENDELRRQIKELESRPVEVAVQSADPAEIEKAVEDAKREAAASYKKEMDQLMKKLSGAEKDKDKLEKALRDAEQKAAEAGAESKGDAERYKAEAERLRRELEMADPVTAEFKGVFEQAATAVSKLLGLLDQAPEATAGNLRAALGALRDQIAGVLG